MQFKRFRRVAYTANASGPIIENRNFHFPCFLIKKSGSYRYPSFLSFQLYVLKKKRIISTIAFFTAVLSFIIICQHYCRFNIIKSQTTFSDLNNDENFVPRSDISWESIGYYFVSRDENIKNSEIIHAVSGVPWLRVHKNAISCSFMHRFDFPVITSNKGDHSVYNVPINCNFLKQPFLKTVIDNANSSASSIVIVSGSDLLLNEQNLLSLLSMYSQFGHFMLLGRSCAINNNGINHFSSNTPRNIETLCHNERKNGFLLAWSGKGPMLFDQDMPNFVFGYGSYERWMMDHVSPNRKLIVVNKPCMFLHKHSFERLNSTGHQYWDLLKEELPTERRFQTEINIFIQKMSSSTKPILQRKVPNYTECIEHFGGKCIISDSSGKTVAFPTPLNRFVSRRRDQELSFCNNIYSTGLEKLTPKFTRNDPKQIIQKAASHFNKSKVSSYPELVKHISQNKSIVLTALSFGHREMMMNWICNMRLLGISNYLVAAFDVKLYLFALSHGVPCYLESSITNESQISSQNAIYGTDEFRVLTKMKSVSVYRLIQLGYNVLWSDSDVIFFRNPLKYVSSFNSDIIIQSNAPDNDAPNGIRRINSGFYYVKSTPRSVDVFAELIKFCKNSPTTEQGCFYDVMCGNEGQHRIRHNKCTYKHFNVHFLDRSIFPNGLTKGIWNLPPGNILNQWPTLYILHNNWVRGLEKTRRLIYHGFLLYNYTNRMCQKPQIRNVEVNGTLAYSSNNEFNTKFESTAVL